MRDERIQMHLLSEASTSSMEKSEKRLSITDRTRTHVVRGCDRLTSIAAHYEMTRSELVQLNRLVSCHIFPGQELLIYEKNFLAAEERDNMNSSTELTIYDTDSSASASAASSRHPSVSASDYSRSRQSSGVAGRSDDETGNSYSVERMVSYIKRNRCRLDVKYITQGEGVVRGNLIVTPNTVMFAANVSDSLVKERGNTTAFDMVASFDVVVRVAIVKDIDAMREGAGISEVIFRGSFGDEKIPTTVTSGITLTESEVEKGELRGTENGHSEETHYGEVEKTVKTENGEVEKTVKTENREVEKTVKTENGELEKTDETKDHGKASLSERRRSEILSSELIERLRHLLSAQNVARCKPFGAPPPRLLPRRRCTTMTGLYSIDDDDDVLDLNQNPSPSSVLHLPNNPCAAVPIAIKNAFFRKCGSFDVRSCGNRSDVFGCYSSCSPSSSSSVGTMVPVFSARSVQRFPSASRLSRISSAGSFVLPTDMTCIVDYSWDMFSDDPTHKGRALDVLEMSPMAAVVEPRGWGGADFYFEDEEEDDSEDDDDSPTRSVFGLCDEDAENATTTLRRHDNARKDSIEVEELIRAICLESRKNYEDICVLESTRATDLPWYFCVVIGRRIDGKTSSTGSLESSAKEPAYWFSVRRQDVPDLYEFFMDHHPCPYGSADEIDPTSRGLRVIDPEAVERKREDHQRSPNGLFYDDDSLSIPDMNENSSILEDHHLMKLNDHLFARSVSCQWKLIFSTEKNGFSLKTLFRKAQEIENDPPCLLVIQDRSGIVFGAMASCMIKIYHRYYGNGETYLFTFKDGFKKYLPSFDDNGLYIYGSSSSICFGADSGEFGLWVDDNLNHGGTTKCRTYNNDLLTVAKDFMIHKLEVWALG